MRFTIIFSLFLPLCSLGQVKELLSPDRTIRVSISISDSIAYKVSVDGQQVLDYSVVDMIVEGSSLGQKAKLKKTQYREGRDTILSPVPEKRTRIPDRYNELSLIFTNGFSLQFRAYDDGVAYRFQLQKKDSVHIQSEQANYQFPDNHLVYYPRVVKREGLDIFHTSFEEPYQIKAIDSMSREDLAFSPVLVKPAKGPKLLLTESDLEDYPGMFISRGTGLSLKGEFAPFPVEEKMTEGEFPQYVVTKRADYIAYTTGSRTFPWRVMVIARHDKELPGNDLVYRLASPSRIGDASWVTPGQGTDEWIIGINLFNVPFKAGINTATYKFYIDFAKRFGFERIMMDAGWSDYKDLFKIHPDIDMEEISRYAWEKGVKLSMWTLALTLEKQLEPALDQFNRWGVDFIMTDFMDRDDQSMVGFYHRMAKACARHKIMIMFHGAFKPAGFNRTYPHAVTREGVLGSEYNIWSDKATPDHNLLLPFIRMVSGPMDYEPGILDNATRETFRPIGSKVMAPGTRAHQMAMFVVYESPIQIFSGNPSAGLLEPAFMELLGSIPTTWDETVILDAALGEYIITARRKGNDWFIAGMTNWNARDLVLDLGFLGSREYDITVCMDGVNADRYASDYILKQYRDYKLEKLTLHLAPGGGFVFRFKNP